MECTDKTDNTQPGFTTGTGITFVIPRLEIYAEGRRVIIVKWTQSPSPVAAVLSEVLDL
jgi:hypothetical protein